MDSITTTAALGPGLVDVPAVAGGANAARIGAEGRLSPTLDPSLFAGILQIATFERTSAEPQVPKPVESPVREVDPPSDDEHRRPERSEENAQEEEQSADVPTPDEPTVALVVGSDQVESQQLVLPGLSDEASEKQEQSVAAPKLSDEKPPAVDPYEAADAEGTAPRPGMTEGDANSKIPQPQLAERTHDDGQQPAAVEGASGKQPNSRSGTEQDRRVPEVAPTVDADADGEQNAARPLAQQPEGSPVGRTPGELSDEQTPAEEQLQVDKQAATGAEGEEHDSRRLTRRERGGRDERAIGREAAAPFAASREPGGPVAESASPAHATLAEAAPVEGIEPFTASALASVDGQSSSDRAATTGVVSNAATPAANGSAAKAGTTSASAEPPALDVQRSTTASAAATSGRTGKSDTAGNGVSTVDRARLVMRVARAFQRLDGSGGTVRLRLHPAELGSVRVEVTLNNRHMRARLVTETEHARSVLAENLPALRNRLAEQGIQVESVNVEVESGDSSNGQQMAEDRHRQPEEEMWRQSAPWRRGRETTGRTVSTEPSASQAASSWRSPTGGIDIRF